MCEESSLLRTWIALRLHQPETDSRVTELVIAFQTLWPALEAGVQPGQYCRVSAEIVDGRVQGPSVDWKLRQTYPRRVG